MKVSFRPAPLGLVILGAAALIGAAAPVRAQENTPSPPTSIEGLVTAATDPSATGPGTLTIHPAAGGDLTLTVDANTHFRKAGGELDTPDEVPPTGAATQAAPVPLPSWYVGLSARAAYDASHDALNVFVSRPEPVQVNGVVDSATTATDLVLDVKGGGTLHLTFGAQTAFRLDGLATTEDKLVAGDLADVLYWMTASDNEALRVDARTPPPLHFEGVMAGPVMADGGFTATHGGTTVQFAESASTGFWLDGKPATAADLKAGDNVSVSYRTDGAANDALQVRAFTPMPKPTPKPPRTRGDHHGVSTGSGDQGSSENSNPSGNPNSNGNTGGHASRPPRPLVVGGLVGSVDATGMTFTLSQGANTLTFAVDANTGFQINDKPATLADLKQGQPVYVVYQATTSANLALKVLIHQPEGQPEPNETGGAHP
jgi:hypothetical protein